MNADKAIKRLGEAGIVPVVVMEEAERAVPVAKAMLAGGIDVMEITFRTAAAADAIRAVAEQCPGMLVGAGTVITLDQCRAAAAAGAKFIVSPGFDGEVVRWCVERDMAVLPGCVTPTEIMAAMKLGLDTVKFFPANIYGGLAAMKALHGPFPGIRFVPTSGVNAGNAAEFLSAPFIHAVGGSWCCSRQDIAAGNYERITALCREARQAVLGFEVAHIGINAADAEAARAVCAELGGAFGFAAKEGSSSIFASDGIEVMKSPYLGERGHIAIRTNRLSIAAAELEKQGYELDPETEKYKDGRRIAVYLKKPMGGFAIHLLQK